MEKIFIYKSISGDTLGSRTDITSKSGMYAIAADLIAHPEIDRVYCSSQQDKQDLVSVINDVNANGLSETSYSSHNINVNIICDESIFKDVEYKKLDWVKDIDEAYEKLHKYYLSGEKAYCEFQGKTLYSDKCDHPDYAYKIAFGKTKAEYDKEYAKSEDAFAEWKRKEQERQALFKQNRPEIIKDYIQKGQKILKEEAWKEWEKWVKNGIQSTGGEYIYSLAMTSLRSLRRGTSYEDMDEKLNNKTDREYYSVLGIVDKFMDYIRYPEKTKSKEKELDKEDEITNIGEIGTDIPTNAEVGKICEGIMKSKEKMVYDKPKDDKETEL